MVGAHNVHVHVHNVDVMCAYHGVSCVYVMYSHHGVSCVYVMYSHHGVSCEHVMYSHHGVPPKLKVSSSTDNLVS